MSNNEDLKSQFVPYEQSCKLKSLGFNERCFAIYLNENSNNEGHIFQVETTIHNYTDVEAEYPDQDPQFYNYNNSKIYKQYTTAPLWQQAFDFFRKNQIDGWIEIGSEYIQIPFCVDKNGGKVCVSSGVTHEEARIALLDYMIYLLEK